jgi:hypothetical protein
MNKFPDNSPRLEYSEIKNYKTCYGVMKNKVIDDYINSSYFKNINKLSFDEEFNYNQWWANWCTASIVEHLIKEGYNIKFK